MLTLIIDHEFVNTFFHYSAESYSQHKNLIELTVGWINNKPLVQ